MVFITESGESVTRFFVAKYLKVFGRLGGQRPG